MTNKIINGFLPFAPSLCLILLSSTYVTFFCRIIRNIYFRRFPNIVIQSSSLGDNEKINISTVAPHHILNIHPGSFVIFLFGTVVLKFGDGKS